MAASTITRTTWTNDTGTPATPVGDGTLLNNARLQDIYAAIDQVLSGAGAYTTLTLGGKLSAEGFGTHSFVAGGTGGNLLSVRNTTAGTGNYAYVGVGNNTSADIGSLRAHASTFTDSLGSPQGGVSLVNASTGRMDIGCNGNVDLRLYTNATYRLYLDGSGRAAWGTTVDTNVLHLLGGSLTASAGSGTGVKINSAITGAANANVVGLWVTPTLIEAGSGTHADLIGALFSAPTVTDAAASTTRASTVFIGGAPSASGATNFALYVSGGQSGLPDGSVSAPALTFGADINTGLYRSGTDDMRLVAGGVDVFVATVSGAVPAARIESGAYGTGNVGGASLAIGRNSSGGGAAGTIGFNTRTLGNFRYVWVDDSANLRIHTGRPTEDNTTVADTAGTVVGTQTSMRATKRAIRAFLDTSGALDLIKRTPLYRFQYREFDAETEHVGIMADESPEFTRYQQTTFDPVNAFGYTAAAIKALLERVEALEARTL